MAMNSIGRASLPQEFFDVTTALLLKQPQPQFLHARLILAALSMELDMVGAQPLNLSGRSMPDAGAPYMGLADMQFELDDPIYPKAITVDTTFLTNGIRGEPVGHTLRINRPQFTDTVYTQESREIPAGSVIATTPIGVGSDQVSLTVKRYGGPYDSVNQRVAPLSIERFDAAHGIHSLKAIRELHLTRDFHKWLDVVGVGLFDSVQASNVIYPQGMIADNDSQVQGDFPMSYAQILVGVRTLDTLGIPLFDNGKRCCLLTPLQAEQLVRDPEWRQQVVFQPTKNSILVGTYVGTVGQVEVFKSVTLNAPLNSNGVPVNRGQMFGPGMVGMAPAEMPRTVTNAQDNYGENPMVIWLFYNAFGVLDSRFGVSLRST